ncbi:MAG: DNA polymerase III subunit delta [Armatimonadota bacterium]|nr:DNA polymerase III subunit delta [Armatimonadota bacterium]MDR7439753.1 DNA polymerase III subunit delta [Armatimonadota bacterium]MDR7562286.1 DNA polymerase III subunit delta [Armatimonadota bacterium]
MSGATARRVMVLVGEEDWLVEEAVEEIVRRHLPPDVRSLNLDRLDAQEIPIEEILARADTLPFFGGCRVVVVRNVDRLSAPAQERLASYLESGAPPCVLVLTARTLDRRRRLAVVLQRVAEVRVFDRLEPGALVPLLQRRARGLRKHLSREAAHALVTLVGGGLRSMVMELEKLAAYTGDRAEIRVEDVREVVVEGGEVSVFELVEAVARGDAPRALQFLHALAASQNPVALVALLAGHFRSLLATEALGPGARPEQVRLALGNRAWLYPRYLAQLRRMRGVDLGAVYQELVEADRQLKSTGLASRVVVERLVVRLTRSMRGLPVS